MLERNIYLVQWKEELRMMIPEKVLRSLFNSVSSIFISSISVQTNEKQILGRILIETSIDTACQRHPRIPTKTHSVSVDVENKLEMRTGMLIYP